LLEGLKREFPFAVRKQDEGGLRSWMSALLKHMQGKNLDAALPLDIRATAFQRQVWTYLQSIPFGETKSYSEVAKAIGQPRACRAVARACASNPVAVEIPCHRVVREDGTMGGYRWGLGRKKALLQMEKGL
jgi:AraC family transcriptional regulator, regulatory protein of adaptative response / methylated-DNA-[protein]-cysteine methyltransferase